MRQDATRGSGTTSTVRLSLPQSEMRAVVMVVADVFREQSLQMAFIELDDVVQLIAPAAFDPTLRHTILPGTFERGPHWAHLQRSNGYGNLEPVLRIPVEDQKPGGRFKRKRFPQLLDDPHARWMPGDVEMQDATTIVADDEEAVQRPESDRWDHEEVHRGDSFPVVPQKRKPALGWLRVPRRSFHPTGDRSLGKIKTEHEKLTVYPRRSPGWVLKNHSEDQLPNFFRRLPSSNPRPDSGDQPPIQTEAGPVPADYRFWSDNDEGLLPTGPDSPSNYPEEFIEEAEDRPWTAPLQHSELLPEREILQDEMPTTTKRASKRSEPEKNQIEHGPELYQNRGRIRQ